MSDRPVQPDTQPIAGPSCSNNDTLVNEKAKQADVTLAKRCMHDSVNEKRYFVKLMIVGKNGAGKSSLLRRLLQEDTKNVESTDGIDIVVRRCKINTETGEWIIDKNGVSDTKQERIQRVIDQTLENNSKDTVRVSKSPTPKSGPDEVQTRNEIETIISGIIDHSEPEPKPKPEPEPVTATVNTTYAKLAEKRDISLLETISTFEDENIEKLEDENIEKLENINEKDNDIKDTRYDSTNNTTTANTLKVNVSKHRSSPLDMPSGLLSDVFASTPNSYNSLNHFAPCGLWDFAGQKEFYATHQAFLTSRAIYLLVAEFTEDIRTDGVKQYFEDMQHSGEYVDFWFDTIHCHQTEEKEGKLWPRVIIIFTGTDKCTKENIKNRKTVLGRQLAEVFGKLNKFKHLQNIYYLSNRTDKDDEFEKLRKEISETATKMNTWGECVPLKWILLEHLIEVNMEKKKNYIEFSDMREMAAHSEIGIEDSKEVLRFLCFQHEVGNIIYFEDIPDLIILNPQWLVDAFRCLVSDKIDPTAGWTDFLQNGLLTKSLITKLFESKSGDNFVGKTKELLDIMLKFDILVKTNEKDKYVMPSMMPTKSFEEVYETIGGDHPNCTRTSWFCLQFEFLPPAFFNHFSAGYMKKYKPTKVNEGKSMALYRGICVFDVDIMDKSESEKLLLTMSANRIAVQLLSFSEKQKNIGNMCCTIRKELISKIKDIEKRYKLKVSYKEHFKCSTGNYYGDTRPYDYLKSVTVYHCDEHKGEHKSEELYLPWMPDEVDDEKKLNDQIQISNKQVKVTPEIDVENVSDDSYVEQQKIFREVIVKESPRKTLNVQNNL
ncbi:probable serine/threonine-protein kinase roco6 [Mytilus trossulus]|uniref:probable serine/threonine-protein kinase roco6 n=1 Tax=Mytilus trossulus TaxID=6551 RepID=UPI0030046EEA